MARRDGLQQSNPSRQLSAFDTEMRRRLWWQTILLDSRAAEVFGTGTSMLNGEWSAKLPFNLNDSELTPEMTSLPHGHGRASEMIFALVRCEVAKFVCNKKGGLKRDGSRRDSSRSSTPLSEKLEAIRVFEAHL